MKKSARLFTCVLCRSQVIICSDCDRGNIYCGTNCSQPARVHSLRMANQLYQKSFRGKQKHAERQRRYRARKNKKVTDQGSPALPTNDLLPRVPNERTTTVNVCNFCGKSCSLFIRTGFLTNIPMLSRISVNLGRYKPK